MKKLLLSGLIFSCIATFAQKREKKTIEITPKIGYSAFSFTGNNSMDVINYSPITSVNFGVSGDYYFNDRWSIRSGLHYQTMGATQILYSYNYPNDGEDKLHYLNIPVNANWHFGSTRKWNLNFGLTPGFLLSAEESLPSLGINNADTSDFVKPFQLGMSFGIGYKLEITEKFGLLFDIQEFVGLTDIAKSDDNNNRNYGGSYNLGAVFKL